MITKMSSEFIHPDVSHLDRAAFLVGTPIAHSSSPALHHAIYSNKKKNFAQVLCETDNLPGFLQYVRGEPKCMGSGVTMPFKVAVIPYLDELTPEAEEIGAVNTICLVPDQTRVGGRRFIGTNTDCIGIRDAFLNNVSEMTYQSFRGHPGLVVGGGGTCRSAIYSLKRFLGCDKIYVINRDKFEVDAVMAECRSKGMGADELIHVETLEQATQLVSPRAIVSAVPNFTPLTDNEKSVRAILSYYLGLDQKGALLEMCYHPSPITQISTLSEQNGWQVIGGIEALIGQGVAQAALWTGLEIDKGLRDSVTRTIQELNRVKGQR